MGGTPFDVTSAELAELCDCGSGSWVANPFPCARLILLIVAGLCNAVNGSFCPGSPDASSRLDQMLQSLQTSYS